MEEQIREILSHNQFLSGNLSQVQNALHNLHGIFCFNVQFLLRATTAKMPSEISFVVFVSKPLFLI